MGGGATRDSQRDVAEPGAASAICSRFASCFREACVGLASFFTADADCSQIWEGSRVAGFGAIAIAMLDGEFAVDSWPALHERASELRSSWSNEADGGWIGGRAEDLFSLDSWNRLEALALDQRSFESWSTSINNCLALLDGSASIVEDALGLAYERTLDPPGASASRQRRSLGAFFTPAWMVERMLDVSLDPLIDRAVSSATGSTISQSLLGIRVCDPACGSGRFLIRAARRIAQRIVAETDLCAEEATRLVWQRCIHGVELSPIACALAHVCAWHEIKDQTAAPGVGSPGIRCGDSLLGASADICRAGNREGWRDGDRWCAGFFLGENPSEQDVETLASERRFFHWDAAFGDEGFDLVIGNPPFLGQLGGGTLMDRCAAAIVRERTSGKVRGYADAASAFLATLARMVRHNGVLSMVQPASFLSARDAAGAREVSLDGFSLRSIWLPGGGAFEDTGVRTCVVTLLRDNAARWRFDSMVGRDARVVDAREISQNDARLSDRWSFLVAAARGVPSIQIARDETIGSVARATADFRDQYYGLQGNIFEHRSLGDRADEELTRFPRLITSGLIDLAADLWGLRTCRVHGTKWDGPRVDLALLERDPTMGAWAANRLVPKVLLATQTRVLEVIVDEQGTALPCTPVVSVIPHSDRNLWEIAAAIASPVSSVVADRDSFGAALSAGAIKLSAQQVNALPLPVDQGCWQEGGKAFRAAQSSRDGAERERMLLEFGRIMSSGYGLVARDIDVVMEWWSSRLSGARNRI